MLRLSVKQYQEIRSMLNEEERTKLNKAYLLVFGCDIALCRLNHMSPDRDNQAAFPVYYLSIFLTRETVK